MCYLLFNSEEISPLNSSINFTFNDTETGHLAKYNDTGQEGYDYDYNGSDSDTQQEVVSLDYKIRQVVETIITPSICAFGIVGNILNLIIFSKRCKSRHVSVLEKSAIIGLASLAASDLAFCLITCVGIFMPYHGAVFLQKGFSFFYQVYAGVFQNVFIKTSTWLTTIACVSRYTAVCYPLWARQFVRLLHIKVAVIAVFILSFTVYIPLFWNQTVHEIECGKDTIYILDSGYFMENTALHMSFVYTWAIFGFLVPALIMIYCNICLIISFRQSTSTRGELRQSSNKMTQAQDRITITLIVVVLLYVILISPSEVLHLYSVIADPTNKRVFILSLVSIYQWQWQCCASLK